MINLNNFGIIQGRLTKSPKNILQYFPQNNWENEFKIAKKLGFKYLELFSERNFNNRNPIWIDSEILKINKLKKKYNIKIDSFCDDYIINNKLNNYRDLNRLENYFTKLFFNLKKISCKKLILPFLETSDLSKLNINYDLSFLKDLSDELKRYNIILCIESIVPGKKLKKLIEKTKSDNLKCVFDTGNRAYLDSNFYEDISILGNLISHVHIKDKNQINQNVILGSGKVNFYSVFEKLKKIKYSGNFIFETTRGSNPIETAKFNLLFCKFLINEIN